MRLNVCMHAALFPDLNEEAYYIAAGFVSHCPRAGKMWPLLYISLIVQLFFFQVDLRGHRQKLISDSLWIFFLVLLYDIWKI